MTFIKTTALGLILSLGLFIAQPHAAAYDPDSDGEARAATPARVLTQSQVNWLAQQVDLKNNSSKKAQALIQKLNVLLEGNPVTADRNALQATIQAQKNAQGQYPSAAEYLEDILHSLNVQIGEEPASEEPYYAAERPSRRERVRADASFASYEGDLSMEVASYASLLEKNTTAALTSMDIEALKLDIDGEKDPIRKAKIFKKFFKENGLQCPAKTKVLAKKFSKGYSVEKVLSQIRAIQPYEEEAPTDDAEGYNPYDAGDDAAGYNPYDAGDDAESEEKAQAPLPEATGFAPPPPPPLPPLGFAAALPPPPAPAPNLGVAPASASAKKAGRILPSDAQSTERGALLASIQGFKMNQLRKTTREEEAAAGQGVVGNKKAAHPAKPQVGNTMAAALHAAFAKRQIGIYGKNNSDADSESEDWSDSELTAQQTKSGAKQPVVVAAATTIATSKPAAAMAIPAKTTIATSKPAAAMAIPAKTTIATSRPAAAKASKVVTPPSSVSADDSEGEHETINPGFAESFSQMEARRKEEQKKREDQRRATIETQLRSPLKRTPLSMDKLKVSGLDDSFNRESRSSTGSSVSTSSSSLPRSSSANPLSAKEAAAQREKKARDEERAKLEREEAKLRKQLEAIEKKKGKL